MLRPGSDLRAADFDQQHVEYLFGGLPQNYQRIKSSFSGPTEIPASGDTLQLKDRPWSMFDAEAKRLRQDYLSPRRCSKGL